eukprot:scaffold13405_cov57-Phaeocystis_antarctica.AAC.4
MAEGEPHLEALVARELAASGQPQQARGGQGQGGAVASIAHGVGNEQLKLQWQRTQSILERRGDVGVGGGSGSGGSGGHALVLRLQRLQRLAHPPGARSQIWLLHPQLGEQRLDVEVGRGRPRVK